MKNINMKYKIITLTLTLIFFIAIIGVLGVSFVIQSNNNLSSIYHNDMNAITITDDMRLQARTTQYELLKYVSIHKDTNKEALDEKAYLIEDMNGKLSNMEKDIAEYKKLKLSDENIAAIDSIEQRYKELEHIVKDFEELVSSQVTETNLRVEAMKSVELLEAFRKESNALMKVHDASADVTYEKNQLQSKRSLNLFVILFISATVLGIVLSFIIIKPIVNAVNLTVNTIEVVAGGDFTQELSDKELSRKDEFGRILNGVNIMRKSLKDMFTTIVLETANMNHLVEQTNEKMYALTGNMEDIASTTEQLSAGMEETSASTEEINATTEDIQSTIVRAANQAKDSETSSIEIEERAENVKVHAIASKTEAINIYKEANHNLKKAIEEAKTAENIKSLLSVILDIASQTNLLALNASIEAARAGEAGRGFSVVADEIGRLADNSKHTVSEIQNVIDNVLVTIENLSSNSNALITFMDQNVVKDYDSLVETGEQYNKDANMVKQLSVEISDSTEELQKLMDVVVSSIQEISSATNQGVLGTSDIAEKAMHTTNMVNDIKDETESMKESINKLSEYVGRFKIS